MINQNNIITHALDGIKVLDLTRVLEGLTAHKFLPIMELRLLKLNLKLGMRLEVGGLLSLMKWLLISLM